MSIVAKWLDGTDVGLGPGDFVLDADPAPAGPRKGAQQPPFLANVNSRSR